MSDDICPSCVEKIKQMHQAQMALNGPNKEQAKKDIEALKNDGISENVDDEVTGILNKLIRRRNQIAHLGYAAEVAEIDGYIHPAKSALTERDYELALDSVIGGAPIAEFHYNNVLQGIVAAKIERAENMVASIASKQPEKPAEADENATGLSTALENAKKLVSENKFKEADEAFQEFERALAPQQTKKDRGR